MTLIETEFEREARLRAPRGRNFIAEDDIIHTNPTDVYVGRVMPRHNSAWFEAGDFAAGVLASTMMLGPLLAYAVGWGA
jgi:hypothetical protein